MKYLAIKFIKLYQKIPGPWHGSCRHVPTCSNYAIEVIDEYGFFKGFIMSVKRVLKCNPWHKPMYDTVKERENEKNN